LALLIVGASTRASAFSALRAGVRPVCFDLFSDRDLAAVCPVQQVDPADYPDAFIRLAERAPPGPWLYTGAIENHPDLIDRISARRTLWGNPASTVRAVRDPRAVADVLRRAGLPVPDVRLSPENLPRDGTWLVKPLESAGGGGIEPLGPSTEPPRQPAYYQERIEGPSLAAIYLGDRLTARLRGVTLQEIGRPGAPFAYAGSLGPWPLAPVVLGRLEALGATLAAAFGLAGLFGVDFVLRDEQPWPVEVNPRYTASVEVLELALGRSLLAEHARAFDPTFSESKPQAGRGYVGKRILYASNPLRFPAGVCRARRLRHHSRFPRLGDIPWPGTDFRFGAPVLTVFAHGTSLESCRRRLNRKASGWEHQLSGAGFLDAQGG
jgi:predicted ATP-grasp superfamily ATP-dependent carboligase